MSTADLLERLSPGDPGPSAERGRAWIDEHGLPTTRLEAWRHTPVDDVVAALLDTTSEVDAPHPSAADLDRMVPDLGGPRIVHVNGRVAPELCRLDDLPPGLTVIDPSTVPNDGADDAPLDGFQALNWIAGWAAAGFDLDADSAAGDDDRPLQIVHLTVGAERVGNTHPRTHVHVGPRSRLQVIEYHATTAGASVTNAWTRLLVDDDAELVHRRIVFGSTESVHIGRVDIEQGADSTVASTSIAVDGAIVRTGIRAVLAGERAHLDLDGLFAPVDRQRHDTVVTVEHAASDGFSNQVFKGIISDRARGSFLGHVVVHADTARNDARQSNPNLILDRSAQVDTNPWLEIYADDVACTHGATVGRLDDDALFYLRSRGIPEAQARAVLLSAFAGEVISHLEPDALRERIEEIFAERTPGGLRLES